MVLRMPCPTKRKGSDRWYFRRTIPSDVQRILAKLTASKRPRNWYKNQIWISLGTADRTLAKAKCPEVAAEVERQIKALREGPKPLTAKQMSALSGEVYKAFALGGENDPVLSSKKWLAVANARHDDRDGVGVLRIGPDTPELREFRLEKRYGRMVDALLRKHALVTDDESRRKLLDRLSLDMPQLAEKLARNADGDFSLDRYAERFPQWEETARNVQSGLTLSGLAQAWHDAALARGVTERNATRFRSVVLRFAKWLGHDDASQVKRADVANWADARSKSGIAASTINKVDTAALRAVFEWGADRGMLEANPLARGVRIEARGKPKVREKFFSDREAAAILNAAKLVQPTKREDQKTTLAKRWVPWLCAYSGARVVEMIQLRKQDVRREEGAWIIRLTPEAGGIKTNEFRDVPMHEDLVKTGFVAFVKEAADGPLFFNAAKRGAISGPIEGVYSRLRQFIRTVVPDRNVQPSHAWRYTFKTRGLEADIERLVLDAICGHAPATKGDDYTKITLKKRIAAMRKFPSYALGQAGKPLGTPTTLHAPG